MNEELNRLVQQYASKRDIKLGEPLGFGVHGNVFAAEYNTKPGFLAVKFHREDRPFEREYAFISACVKSKRHEFAA
jgi:RIO-like serine/threonine protein kinase